MGEYQSGQMGQTVNLLVYTFGGSNPSSPTITCGSSSVDRASAFQAEGREFEPRLPLKKGPAARLDLFCFSPNFITQNNNEAASGLIQPHCVTGDNFQRQIIFSVLFPALTM